MRVWRLAGGTPLMLHWTYPKRLHPLIPRETDRFKALYHQRGAVELEFGVLKHQWALLPLRVRCIAHTRLHADLTILATLPDAAVKVSVSGSAV